MGTENGEEKVWKAEPESPSPRIAEADRTAGSTETVPDRASCYTLLRVSPDATLAEVTAAYEKKVAAWQEDQYVQVPLWKETAGEKQKELKDAYEKILSFRQSEPEGHRPEPAPAEREGLTREFMTVDPEEPLQDQEILPSFTTAKPPGKSVRPFLAGAVLLMAIAIAASFWPTLYHYETIQVGDKVFPLRMNRLTAKATYFDGRQWANPPLPVETEVKATQKNIAAPAPVQTPTAAPSVPPPETEGNKPLPGSAAARPAPAMTEAAAPESDLTFVRSAPAAPSVRKTSGDTRALSPGKPAKHGAYSIQLKAFREESRARAFLGDIPAGLTDIRIQKVDNPDRTIWYCVLVGNFQNKDKALDYLRTKRLGDAFPGSFVRTTGKAS